jgi:hypothetical protein
VYGLVSENRSTWLLIGEKFNSFKVHFSETTSDLQVGSRMTTTTTNTTTTNLNIVQYFEKFLTRCINHVMFGTLIVIK